MYYSMVYLLIKDYMSFSTNRFNNMIALSINNINKLLFFSIYL